MKKGLTATGQTIYFVVMAAAVVIDLIVQFRLFASGNIGGAVAYLFIGWMVTLTIGHLIGMALAAPFVVAGSLGHDD